MATERGFAGKRLPMTLAFAVLLVAAFGAGCKNFFQDPTLSSVAIQPPSPQVEVGQSTTLQAWGTYSDNSRKQIKSGVVWTSSDSTVISIDQNTGQITGQGSGGTATITASAQGLSGTATGTSFLGSITGLTVCSGAYDTGTCPAATWSISSSSSATNDYYARALDKSSNKIDVTTVATFAVTPTPTTGSIQCDNTSSPAVCTLAQGTTPGNYLLTVSYPNVSPVTASIVVSP